MDRKKIEEMSDDEIFKYITDLKNTTTKETNKLETAIKTEDIKEKNILLKLWDKTIFPEMIRRRKEEKTIASEIKHRARIQALYDSEDELIAQYKKQHLDKLSGNKKSSNWLSKIGEGFADAGKNLSDPDKISNMIGSRSIQNENNISNMLNSKSNINKEKLKKPNKKSQNINNQIFNEESFENKINRFLR